MWNSRFFSRFGENALLTMFGYRDVVILVPGECPRMPGRFVEEEGSNDADIPSENVSKRILQHRVAAQFHHPRPESQQITRTIGRTAFTCQDRFFIRMLA